MKPIRVVLLVLALSLTASFTIYTKPPGNTSTSEIAGGRYPSQNGEVVWYIENVDISGTVGQYTAIALDSCGRPHISYYDYGSENLRYIYFDGSAWNMEVVDSENDVGQYNSIAIDSNNLPHISYSDDTNEFTKYAHYNGSFWEYRIVDVSEYVGEYTDIVLNSSDYPRISYYRRRTYRNLMYARTNNGVSWTTETAASSGDVGLRTSIDLDSDEYSHISHFDSEHKNIKYTYEDAGGWHTLTAPRSDVNFSITETSISLDSYDNVYISYRQVPLIPSSHNLICAQYNGTSWGWWTVDSNSLPGIGTASSIVAGSQPFAPYLHIGYHGSDGALSGALKHAYYTGTWQTEVVDPSNNLGDDDVSIAIDNSVQPHVHMSYYVETLGYLRYAVRNYVPEATDVSISPPYPTDDDGLTGSYIFSDGNSDPDSSIIMWYIDDVHDPAYDGVLTIPAEDASLGQEWQLSVTPYDGYGYGTTVYYTVRINALPVTSNLRFFPASPNTTDPLGARYDYFDANGDPDHSLTYWYKDGISQPQYTNWDDVPPSATKKAEVWKFWIRPNDGIEYGDWAGSPEKIIANSLPFVDFLIIEPAPIANPYDDIMAEYIFTDPDHPEFDPDFSQIHWYINDELQSYFNNLTTLYYSATASGDSVYFTVQAYDNEDYGNTDTSFVILINTLPTVSNLLLTPGSPYTTDVLTAHYDFSDGDDHSDQSEISWYKNDTYESNGPTVPSSATVKGQEWYFKVKPYDGFSYGTEQTSPTVTILNSQPVAANVQLCPLQPWTGNDLTAGYEFIDADNDPETETEIYWYRNDILQTAYANKQLVPASATYPGDEWYLAVQLSDGEEESTYEISQTETITAEPPENDTPGCFLSGTSILMADGSQKPIEAIEVGDFVLSYDETNRIMIPDRVSETLHHPKEDAYLIINGYMRVTPVHRVLSRDRWISIGELDSGDPLTDTEGSDIDIDYIIAINEPVNVYNFEVESFHTYVADGYVVHNKKPEIQQDLDLDSVLDGDQTQPSYFLAGNDVLAKDEDPPIPDMFRLFQNYPNPFNPATTIQFDLPQAVHVRLCVYSVDGGLVATIVDRQMAEGRIEVFWAGRDDRGIAASSGIYFYRLIAGDFVQTKKMVLLR